MLASQWIWQRTKSVNIPAEEQNAGRAVDYFYRMEFHITPRFFSDSNYLFFFGPIKKVSEIVFFFTKCSFKLFLKGHRCDGESSQMVVVSRTAVPQNFNLGVVIHLILLEILVEF